MAPALARIPSTGNISAVTARGASSAWRNHQSAAGQSRRTSHEAGRPKSRCSSTADLLTLAAELPPLAPSSRPVTPHALVLLTEGPAAALVHQQHADDTLAHIASLAGQPAVDDVMYASWASLSLETAASDSVAQPAIPAVAGVTPEQAILRSLSDASTLQPAEQLQEQAVPPVPIKSRPAAVKSTVVESKESLCLAEEPTGPTTTIFRGVHDFSYVQELLDNLRHTQQMFKNVGSGSTPAPSAMAAARMLSRSLTRAATRVRGIAKDAAAVVLVPEAMHTLMEFGWAEVVTFDAACAKALGTCEMEIHHLTAGRSSAFHRAKPDDPWVKVGVSGSSTQDVIHLLQGVPPHCLAAAGDVTGPAAAVLSALDSCSGESARLLTLADLADQLVQSSELVKAAAATMQQWIEEQKAAAAAMISAASAVVQSGLESVGAAPVHKPVMVTAGAM